MPGGRLPGPHSPIPNQPIIKKMPPPGQTPVNHRPGISLNHRSMIKKRLRLPVATAGQPYLAGIKKTA